MAGAPTCPAPPTTNTRPPLRASGRWQVSDDDPGADLHVHVHPNNPDGRRLDSQSIRIAPFTVIDESFCDTCPDASCVARTARPGTVVLKSFGKFWGLAGLRLGFAIAHPDTLLPADSARNMAELLGPWPSPARHWPSAPGRCPIPVGPTVPATACAVTRPGSTR